MTAPLVLSLFPGIDLLGMAFELEGFCVVAGPDVQFGRDIRTFHAPRGRFDGVIGGPPCQAFSPLNQSGRLGLQPLAANLIPEFERVVAEAGPAWFVMENVAAAPMPRVAGYSIDSQLLNNRWLGEEQNRVRRFSFGSARGERLNVAPSLSALDNPTKAGCFTANGTQWEPASEGGRGFKAHNGRSRSTRTVAEFKRGCRLQGLPDDFLDNAPFTVEGKIRLIGNGVPLPMGRAIAKAVKRAMYPEATFAESASCGVSLPLLGEEPQR